MTLFQPDRALLYPQFETYRLHSLSPDDDVSSYPLPGAGATQARLEHAHHNLSFKETRARIGWDHLSVDEYGRGVYIDKEWKVWGVTLDASLQPVFALLAELPTPVSTSSAPAPEYPSALPLNSTTWIVNSGTGTLYLLSTTSPTEAFSGQMGAEFDLGQPYLLQAAHSSSAEEAKLLLSRSVMEGRKHVGFELIELRISLEQAAPAQEVSWRLNGGDAPLWCSWTEGGWMVLSSEQFKKEEAETSGSGQNSGDTLARGMALDTPKDIAPTPAEHPFTWKQTGDSASIRLLLAPGTKRTDLAFSLTTSSFKLSSRVEQSGPLSKFLDREHSWWAPINIEESSLSFDPIKASLEVDIAKVDSPNRWSSLFLPSESIDVDGEEEEGEFDVPETIDASMLAAVRATFDNIRSRDPEPGSGQGSPAAGGPSRDEPTGNHPAIPSLLREEMDFDMEDGEDFEDRASGALGDQGGKVGRDVFIGRIKEGYGEAEWSKTSSSVVSLPFSNGAKEGLILKSAVDGLLYEPPLPGASGTTSTSFAKKAWSHTATIPALSFVLSSKRDIRLVRHLHLRDNTPESANSDITPPAAASNIAVMAFDSGGPDAGQGNAYVYYPPISKTVAKQGVVRVSGRERGALLGLASIDVKQSGGGDSGGDRSKKVVLALCEKELVVLTGVV